MGISRDRSVAVIRTRGLGEANTLGCVWNRFLVPGQRQRETGRSRQTPAATALLAHGARPDFDVAVGPGRVVGGCGPGR